MTCRAHGKAFRFLHPTFHEERHLRQQIDLSDSCPLPGETAAAFFRRCQGIYGTWACPPARRPGETDAVYFAQILEEVGGEWVQLPLAGGGVFLRVCDECTNEALRS